MLSGLAMATAGSSRPCSGGDHEILHAIDHLFPGTANHGELAGAASLFTSFLRGDDGLARGIDACLRRHGLPRTPRDLGLTEEQFVEAVVRGARHAAGPLHDPRAPRAGRGRRAARGRGIPRCLRSLSCARPPSRPRSSSATAASTGPGRLYMRRVSPYLTRALLRTRITPNGVTWLMILAGLAAAAVLALPGRAAGRRRLPADPAADPARLLRRRGGALAGRKSVRRRLPGPDRPLADRGGAADRARHPRRRRLGSLGRLRSAASRAGAADQGRVGAGDGGARGGRAAGGGRHARRSPRRGRRAAAGAAGAGRAARSTARSWRWRRRCWRWRPRSSTPWPATSTARACSSSRWSRSTAITARSGTCVAILTSDRLR